MGWPSQVPENLFWPFLHFLHNFPSPGPLGDGIRHAVRVAEREAGKTRTEHMISTGDQLYDVVLSGERNMSIVRDNLVGWKWQTHILTIIHGKV